VCKKLIKTAFNILGLEIIYAVHKKIYFIIMGSFFLNNFKKRFVMFYTV
jgi:hypothetical protein